MISVSEELEREMNNRPCIYIAWSKITGKAYVGVSRFGLLYRKQQHLSSNSIDKFHKALREEGLHNFIWEILEIIWDNLSLFSLEKLLKEKEQFYIKLFDSIQNGYNSSVAKYSCGMRKYLTWEDKKKAHRETVNRYIQVNKEICRIRNRNYKKKIKSNFDSLALYNQKRKEYRDNLSLEEKCRRLKAKQLRRKERNNFLSFEQIQYKKEKQRRHYNTWKSNKEKQLADL